MLVYGVKNKHATRKCIQKHDANKDGFSSAAVWQCKKKQSCWMTKLSWNFAFFFSAVAAPPCACELQAIIFIISTLQWYTVIPPFSVHAMCHTVPLQQHIPSKPILFLIHCNLYSLCHYMAPPLPRSGEWNHLHSKITPVIIQPTAHALSIYVSNTHTHTQTHTNAHTHIHTQQASSPARPL